MDYLASSVLTEFIEKREEFLKKKWWTVKGMFQRLRPKKYLINHLDDEENFNRNVVEQIVKKNLYDGKEKQFNHQRAESLIKSLKTYKHHLCSRNNYLIAFAVFYVFLVSLILGAQILDVKSFFLGGKVFFGWVSLGLMTLIFVERVQVLDLTHSVEELMDILEDYK